MKTDDEKSPRPRGYPGALRTTVRWAQLADTLLADAVGDPSPNRAVPTVAASGLSRNGDTPAGRSPGTASSPPGGLPTTACGRCSSTRPSSISPSRCAQPRSRRARWARLDCRRARRGICSGSSLADLPTAIATRIVRRRFRAGERRSGFAVHCRRVRLPDRVRSAIFQATGLAVPSDRPHARFSPGVTVRVGPPANRLARRVSGPTHQRQRAEQRGRAINVGD